MTSAEKTYRVFILDDNESQLMTMQAILEDEGFVVVAYSDVFKAFDFLESNHADVAIFDLRMPGISELDLIERIRPVSEHIPVIINTAYGSFDTAKKAVNVGAFAYLEKGGDPGNLVREVNRAIHSRLEKDRERLESAVRERTMNLEQEVIRRRMAEEAMFESEKKYRLIAENASDVIWIIDLNEHRMTYVSPSVERLRGFTPEEVLSEDFMLSVATAHRAEVQQKIDDGMQDFLSGRQEVFYFELQQYHKNGSLIWVEMTVSPRINPETGHVEAYGSSRDISARKQSQKALDDSHRELETIYESIPVAVMLIDKLKKIYKTNRVTQSIASCNEEDILNHRCGEIFNCVHHLDHPKGCGYTPFCGECVVNHSISTTLKTKKSIHNAEAWVASFENNVVRRRSFLLSTSHLKLNEEDYVLLSAQDITERKLMEIKLTESETRYRNLFENNAAAMIIIDPENGQLSDVNKAAQKFYGYTRRQIKSLSIFDINTASKKSVTERIKGVLLQREKHFFAKHRLANGQIRDVEVFSGPVLQGEKKFIYSIIFDVTDKRRYEEALINSELRFRTFMNSTNDMMFIKDQQLRYIYSNVSNAAFHGLDNESIIGRDDASLMNKKDALVCHKSDMNAMKSGKLSMNEEIVNDRVYETTKFPVQLPDGNIGVGGIIRDITERYKSIETIKENERKLRTLMRNLQGMAYRCRNDRQWTMLFVSEGCRDLTGYESDELLNNQKVSFNDLIHPDYREWLWKTWQKRLREKKPFVAEYLIRSKSGEWRWVFEKGAGVYDAKGKVIALEGFISDITSLKQAESALRESEQLYRTLVETSPNGILILDRQNKIRFANTRFARMFGFQDADNVAGSDSVELLTDEATLRDLISRESDLLKIGKIDNLQLKLKHRNGSMIPVEVNVTLVNSESPDDMQIIVVFQDISYRIESEEKLRFNARLERALAETLAYVSRPETTIHEIACYIARELSMFLPKPFICTGFFPEMLIPSSAEIHHPVNCGCTIQGDNHQVDLIHSQSSMHRMITEQLRKINKPILMNDLSHFNHYPGFSELHPGFANLMIIPVRVSERKLGYLLLSDLSRKLTRADQAIAERFANIFALALNREIIQQELRDMNIKFQQLAANINGVFLILSRNFRKLQYINPVCLDLLGYSPAELIQQPLLWFNKVHVDERRTLKKQIAQIRSNGVSSDMSAEFRLRSSDGRYRWLHMTVFPVFNDQGEVIRYAGTIFDITERKTMQMVELNAIIKGENNERQRFAQELHDGLGPLLSTLRMYMQAIGRTEDPALIGKFTQMSEKLFYEATRSITEISNNISPHILINFGLREAMKSFVDKIISLHNIQVYVDCLCEHRFNTLIETTIYRILCELINNSIKYSKASELSIRLTFDNNQILLHFSDNGNGFDVEAALASSKGMGLSNIRNRVHNLQGKITMESTQNAGFQAIIRIPAEPEH